MGFVKKIATKHTQDAGTLYVFDDTLDYVVDDDYGWGVGSPTLQRSDYYLLNFVKYIDEAGVETYLDQVDQYPSVNDKSHGLADGNGLANTDRSMFTITTPKDGHHIVYMVHLEKDTTRVSGTLGDVYWNTSDSKAYYHNGTAFVEITEAILPSLESLSVTKVCEYLLDIRLIRYEDSKIITSYTPKKVRNESAIMQIRDMKNIREMMFANFTAAKPVSRFLVNSLTNVVNGQ